MAQTIKDLEIQLNDFDLGKRTQALDKIVQMAEDGEISLAKETEMANMHCHTFFSFNAYGYSPSNLAWMGKQRGYKLMGIVDFDVLDGVDEFLGACEKVSLRGSAGIETRIFIPEFSTREINSPGEPGVYYHMGIGFTSGRAAPEAAPILEDMRQRAVQRNRDMVKRLNAYLDPVEVDYEKDVLPLTPGGTATERHLLVAYAHAAERKVSDPLKYWAEKMNTPLEKLAAMKDDFAAFSNLMRSKLMKRGGIGYVQPDAGAFPTLDEFHKMILACQALPCAAWLDGTSAGEQAIEELLELLISKGVVALNIIPDRNWNIADVETRQKKVRLLYEVIQLAQRLDLPLNIGTEINSPGQKLMDDYHVPELLPVRQAFLDGAYFVYGHTVMQRACGMGYQSDWANTFLPNRKLRNAFYTSIGYNVPPGLKAMAKVKKVSPNLSPADVLKEISKYFYK